MTDLRAAIIIDYQNVHLTGHGRFAATRHGWRRFSLTVYADRTSMPGSPASSRSFHSLTGPGSASLLGAALFRAALGGWPLRWVGDLDQPFTPTYIGDFARVLATLGDTDGFPDDKLGRVWHVPHPAPTTGREFVRTLRQQAGTRAPVLALGSGFAPTPYDGGIARTLSWYRNPVPAPDAAQPRGDVPTAIGAYVR